MSFFSPSVVIAFSRGRHVNQCAVGFDLLVGDKRVLGLGKSFNLRHGATW